MLAFAPAPAGAQQSSQPDSTPAGDATVDAFPDANANDLSVPPPPPDVTLPQVEPIITNSEFEADVPQLDPASDDDLSAPLESIEEFERRLSSEQTDAPLPEAGEAPPQPASATDQPAEETFGDAPINDAELNAPLPPLSQFNVEPVQFTEDEADSELTEVEYRIVVNGLDAVDEETDVDLSRMFRDLSGLHEGDEKAANVAQVAARLSEDSKLMSRILSSEGWFSAQVSTRIDRSEMANGQPLSAIIDVVPGPRYTFADIVIDAPPTVPPDLIRENLALRVGEPIIAARVQAAEAKVAVALPQTGYPFGAVGQRDVLLDQQTADGVYTLPVTPGPRSVFGEILTTGDLAFDAEHVDILARFKKGELYDSRMVDDLRQALVATGLFNTISVSPERTDQSAGDGLEYANVLVVQEAGPPRSISGSAGYGTGQGLRLEGVWIHRNMFPPEGALIVGGVAGTQEQGANVTFRRLNAGKRDRTFSLVAEALHSDYDAYEAFTGRLAALVSYDSTPLWQKRFTYAYGARLIATNEQDYDFDLGKLTRRMFYIAALSGQAQIDTSNSLLNPTSGFRVSALVEPEGSFQDGGFTPYVRLRTDASAYLPVSDSLVLAGRVAAGTIQGISRYNLAPSQRFYAGGGGSVRGYGYQMLGPKVEVPNPKYPDPDEIEPDTDPEDLPSPTILRPIGGRSVIEGSTEVRYRFGNFGVVGFVDAGQVYEETYPTFKDIRFGVGIGGRYYTNFGPLRVDVATPIDRRSGESWITVYVSIGQAF